MRILIIAYKASIHKINEQMIKLLLTSALILGASLSTLNHPTGNQETQHQTELDDYWQALSKSVEEGDFEGYKALYHEDAVVIFATGQNKASISIADALAGWKKGFDQTKAGKQKGSVAFRFSQRISNKNTAHETGMFAYSAEDSTGKMVTQYIHFESLLVKRDGKWLATMEYQKERATQEEWDALK